MRRRFSTNYQPSFLAPQSAKMRVPIYRLLTAVFLCLLASCGDNPPISSVTPLQPEHVYVLEYRPAMGQFINMMPEYADGDTYEDILRKAEESLNKEECISLGGFGGYVTLRLGTDIENHEGYDFQILGNAFYATGSTLYGNSEPGIVSVSIDENENGLPDDTWYELAGSEYFKNATIHDYKKTWCKSDTSLLNKYHTQPYFPLWLSDTIIEVSGTCLASHKSDIQGVIAQKVLDFGYADNKPNTDADGISFDIDWAVDSDGIYIKLTHCDFVRIMTGVDEVYPQIGELSTEVAGLKRITNNK